MVIRKCSEEFGIFLKDKGGGLKEEDLMKRNGTTMPEKEKKITWENGHAFHDIEA